MGDTDAVAHQDGDRTAGLRHLLAIRVISEIFRLAFKEKKLFKEMVGQVGLLASENQCYKNED